MNTQTSTIDPEETAKFSALAQTWWDRNGPFKPLHVFNPTRLGFLREEMTRHFGLAQKSRTPLDGLRILDVGCGGGLLCEPLTRLGAQMTGIDASDRNIGVARTHADEMGLQIDYRATSVEALIEAGEPVFDVVLTMEVVEHVADVDLFLSSCAQLVRPGGLLVLATLNRTAKAFALAIVGAEYVLGWLPRGTHDWQRFVTPAEAARPLRAAGMQTEPAIGVSFNPLTGRWSLSQDTDVNYMMVARAAPAS